jgi:hypothetical protein
MSIRGVPPILVVPPILFVGAPSRIDRTMAPDFVLANRHAAPGPRL